MKKILTFALAVAAIGSMSAQQDAVKAAKKLSGKLDKLEDARTTIKGALENPETGNLAETWYIAGKIEMDAFDANKKNTNGAVNLDMAYQILNGLNYWDKAGELDNPEKPKFAKDIVSKAVGHIDDMWGGASEFFNQKKYFPESYTLFNYYGDMEGFIPDSIRGTAIFWAGNAALNAHALPEAIEAFRKARDLGYDKPNAYIGELAAWQQVGEDSPLYAQAKENIDGVARAGYAKYGMDQPIFITNIVNDLVQNDQFDDALKVVNDAIAENEASAHLYNLLSFTYGRSGNYEGMDQAIRKMVACQDVDDELLLDAANKILSLGTDKNNNINGNTAADQAAKKAVYNDYVEFGLNLVGKVLANDPTNGKAKSLKDRLEYLGELTNQ